MRSLLPTMTVTRACPCSENIDAYFVSKTLCARDQAIDICKYSSVYLIDVLRRSQEYFTYTTLITSELYY